MTGLAGVAAPLVASLDGCRDGIVQIDHRADLESLRAQATSPPPTLASNVAVHRATSAIRSPSAPTNRGAAGGQAANPLPGEERCLAVAGKRTRRLSR